MKNLKTKQPGILLLAIGNYGRGDDGLGWKFADRLQEMNFNNIAVEYRYQLQVEDAELISKYTTVIFVDASHKKLESGFEINSCKAAGHFFYSSHMQSPEAILYLANNLYNNYPEAYTIEISGNDWGLKIALSKDAEQNLQSALTFFKNNFLPAIQTLARGVNNSMTA